MSRYYSTEGVIIKTRPLGESDKVYTVLSADYGKFEAKARSSRLIKSKLSGSLEIFSMVKLYLARGKSMDVITQVELIDSHSDIRSSLTKLAAGFYLLEIFNKSIIDHEKDYKVYALLKQALTLISGHENLDIILRAVEVRLLFLLGYQPVLDRCVACSGRTAKLDYINVTMGGLLCQECFLKNRGSFTIYPATKEVMRYFQKFDINKVNRIKLTEDVMKNIFKINTMFYMTYFNYKIASIDFINKLKEKQTAGV
ncbi:MAG: DNA repair protein RecO [Armatimonadota bacterium]